MYLSWQLNPNITERETTRLYVPLDMIKHEVHNDSAEVLAKNKETQPESDQASRSKHHFAGNTKTRGKKSRMWQVLQDHRCSFFNRWLQEKNKGREPLDYFKNLADTVTKCSVYIGLDSDVNKL